MLPWLSRTKREPGWMAVSLAAGELHYARAHNPGTGRSTIHGCGTLKIGDSGAIHRVVRELQPARFQCSTLLDPNQYQLLMVEAPNVPRAELKAAIRWRVKDMIDYHVDDATVDVLDVPQDGGATGRQHMMFAVAAPNEAIQATVDRYFGAEMPIAVIDIQETAQRNISAFYEEADRGVALLYLSKSSGLLTISYRQELHFSRRIDIGLDQLARRSGEAAPEAFGRIALELQRTFDHFDRQFRHVTVSRLMVGPEPADSGLVDHLRGNFEMPVEAVELDQILDFAGDAQPDRETQWRLFHLIGAALRHEPKAL